jgi:serine/threonine protein kinase
VYAIKKILLKKKFRAKIIREVVMLSRLYHKNVIRYYQSWIEVVHPDQGDSPTASSVSGASATTAIASPKLLSRQSNDGGALTASFHITKDVTAYHFWHYRLSSNGPVC